MLFLQAAIGALNDVVDAPRDAGHKPGKPIPAGLVPPRVAVVVSVAAALSGLLLTAPSGAVTLGLAVLILLVGAAYDLRLKGTSWSWLPFAVGIPLLPVYAWTGAAGRPPDVVFFLLPAGFVAGAALAIGNALADAERDRSAGVTSIALRLGRRSAWRVHAALHGLVVSAAVGTAAVHDSEPGIRIAAFAGVGAMIGAGVLLAASGDAGRRERGWELQAVGVALLAAVWLVAVA